MTACTLSVSALLLLAWLGCSGDGRQQPEATPRSTADVVGEEAQRQTHEPPPEPPPVTISAPTPGMVTSSRTITVSGDAKDDGESIVTVSVNGRPIDTFLTPTGYSTPVALELGRNEIVAHRRLPSDDERGSLITRTAQVTVERRRSPGDDTGVLDRATAAMLADSTDKTYWLCGEDEDCTSDPVCFALTPRRIDCAVAYWYVYDLRRRCGHVYTLRLRGNRLYGGDYACQGFLNPKPRERFVHVDRTPALHRIVIDADEDQPWYRTSVNEPNRYGAPRFSMAHDVFLP